jgi:hypothetical protein
MPSNIHVQRFPETAAIAMLIAPTDRAWVVQVDHKDQAVFFRQVPNADTPEPVDGYPPGVRHVYVDAELPSVAIEDATVQPQDEAMTSPQEPIDWDVFPGLEGQWEGAKMGFWARLNVRSIVYWGETEHEAVRALVNGVAKLCTAGSLDHTGRPVMGNPRRRAVVFPRESIDSGAPKA